ncbi:hypothetical protein ED039_08200, partial [Salmonella enterica]|nr:hypothetical protein [Salmonella enterica]
KRVSIGRPGDGAFDGSTPCINIGDSDSGFVGSADGVLDIYCNNAKVGYIDGTGLHMLTGIATNGDVVLQGDARRHIAIFNEDGNARMWLYKDKNGDGIRINNGIDGGGEFVFNKNSEFYSPSNLHAGDAIFGNNGDVYGAAWGNVWLTKWLDDAFTFRDNNINALRNTASLGMNGWFKDASTGLIKAWGFAFVGDNNIITVNLPITFPNACVGLKVTARSGAGNTSDQVLSAYGQIISNSQIQVAVCANWGGNGAEGVYFEVRGW